MKRICCLIVAVVILVLSTMSGVFAFVDDDFMFKGYLTEGQSSVTSIAAWGEHLFAAEKDGVGIYNLNTLEKEAKWNLKSNSIIPQVGSSFEAAAIAVTDKYVIVASKTAIAVFPNEGEFTSTPPTLIRRLGLVNNIQGMRYENGYLYVFDQVGTATVRGNGTTTYLAESGSVVMWKIDINNVDAFPYSGSASLKYSALNVENMISSEYATLVNLGKYDYSWGSPVYEDGHFYIVTYNNVNTAPYKTLYLNNVNAADMASNKIVLSEASPNGLSVSFFTETGNVNEIKALYVYEQGSESNKKLLSDFARKVQVTCVEYTDGTYYTTVYFSDMATFASYLNVSEAEISSGDKTFAISYGGEEQVLSYSENTEALSSGAVAVCGETVYAMTGSGARGETAILAQPNYAYIVDAADESDMTLSNSFFISIMPDYGNGKDSAVQSIAVIGDYLVYFCKSVGNHAMIMNIKAAEEMTGSVAATIHIPTRITSSSSLSQALVYGGNIYYPTANNVAVIETSVFVDKMSVPEVITNFPASISGESSEGKESGEVNITIGADSYTALSACGAYNIPIMSLPNGDYSVSSASNQKEISVLVDDAVEISDFALGTSITFKAKNNTNKHFIKTQSIKFVAAAYTADGTLSDTKSQTSTIAYGKETGVSITSPQIPSGGSLVIYALSGKKLLDAPYSAQSGKEERSTEVGKEEMSGAAAVNEASKTVTVSGSYLSGALLYVTAARSGATVDIKTVRCQSDGRYTYSYSYANDVIMTSETYSFEITAIGGETEVTAEVRGGGEFESEMTTLLGVVTSGDALYDYLKNNEAVALALGINIDDEDFSKLESGKVNVMDKVFEKLKNGEYASAEDVFKEETAAQLKAQTEASALYAAKNAVAASLEGVLEEYKDVYGILDELWTKYQNKGKKKSNVNSYFVKNSVKKIQTLSDVSKLLKESINSLSDDGGDGGNNVSYSPKNEGSYQAPAKEPIAITPVEPYTSRFKDVSDAHWAYAAIEYLAERGIVNGVGEREFAPERELSREEAVKLLIEAFNKTDLTAVSSFQDVEADAWYYKYIASAEKIGLVKGDGESFGIGERITRQDLAVMVLRMADIAGATLSEGEAFEGEGAADYAKEAIGVLIKNGIMTGDESGSFNPLGYTTRAMATKVIYGLITLGGGAK